LRLYIDASRLFHHQFSEQSIESIGQMAERLWRQLQVDRHTP
jgi:hypothetical protein